MMSQRPARKERGLAIFEQQKMGLRQSFLMCLCQIWTVGDFLEKLENSIKACQLFFTPITDTGTCLTNVGCQMTRPMYSKTTNVNLLTE